MTRSDVIAEIRKFEQQGLKGPEIVDRIQHLCGGDMAGDVYDIMAAAGYSVRRLPTVSDYPVLRTELVDD